MNLYVTTTELKTYLGISGSTQDSLLGMLNKQATMLVNGIIGVSDLSLHKISDEVHDAKGSVVYLSEAHPVRIGTIMDDDTEYTQEEAYDLQDRTLYLENYLKNGYRALKVSYAAGWNARQMAYIDIVDYSGLALDTVTVGGVVKTAGTNWTAGTSNAATATSLATAINGLTTTSPASKTVSAFALGSRVYILDDEVGGTNNIAISASDTTSMTLSAAALGGIDFPEDIKAAVMMMVSFLKNQSKNRGIKSYTIGQKTISFADDGSFAMFEGFLRPYIQVKLIAI